VARLNDDDDSTSDLLEEVVGDDWWQVGAGLAFGLGEVASISLAAAMGEGPVVVTDSLGGGVDSDVAIYPWANSWWGVSGIITGHLTDEIHAEVGAGYLSRDFNGTDGFDSDADFTADSDRWVIAGGLYYNPVDQLTIGLEASYSDFSATVTDDDDDFSDTDYRVNVDSTDTTIALLSVWRF
jgi:opacity protein-like surface antigen